MRAWIAALVMSFAWLLFGCAGNAQTYGARAYVANFGANTVSVIDDDSRKVVATITTGDRPVSIAIAPDGTAVYVANEGTKSLSVIDPVTNTVTSTIALSGSPHGIGLTADGAYALVALNDTGSLEIVDTKGRSGVGTFPVGKGPDLVVMSVDGSEAYVSCDGESAIAVFDVQKRQRIGDIKVYGTPRAMAMLGSGKMVVTMRWLNGFALVDPGARKLSGGWLLPQIRLPGETGVKPFPKDGVFGAGVGGYASGGVALWLSDSDRLFYDVDTSKDNYIIGFAPTGANPWSVAVSPDGKTAYITNSGDDNVVLIDMIQRIPLAKPGVGKNPRALALGRVKVGN